MKYYLINTNKKADPTGYDEKTMLDEKIVSLYFEHYKQRINKLNEGDMVFLYSNGKGIIAFGKVHGETQIRDYRSEKFKDEEYFRHLSDFKLLKRPITVAMVKNKVGKKMPVYKSIAEINEVYAHTILELASESDLSIAS